jgi:hypothetical protein
MEISFRMLIHERVESEEERAVLSCANFIIDLSNRLSPDTDIVTVESNPKGRDKTLGQQSILSVVGTPGPSAVIHRRVPMIWGNKLLLGPIRRRELFCIQVLSYDLIVT